MKRMISVILAASMLAAAVPVMADSEPVMSDWAASEIAAAEGAGILNTSGLTDTTVQISRGRFCEMVYNAIEDRLDVHEGDSLFSYTVSAAMWDLYRAGIVKGTGTDDEPDMDSEGMLTREQAAAILSRAAAYTGIEIPEIAAEYDDEAEISDWAAEAVNIVSALGIMTGDGGLFMPKDTYTIEQAAASVMRLYRQLPAQRKIEPQSFADKLNDRMPENKNYMFSPLSVKMAFAMAANGANGETRSEMLKALGIGDLDEYNEKAKRMIEAYAENDVIRLSVANSLWRNTDNDILTSGFSESYKKTISEYYKGEANDVTNANAVGKINGWVNEKTNEKIPAIISDPDFDAMLINAVYFKAAWEDEFSEGGTYPDTFTSRDGAEKQIDFMHKTGYKSYSNVNGVKILELPYKTRIVNYNDEYEMTGIDTAGANVSMYIILSDNVNAEEAIENADFSDTYVAAAIPKFRIEFSTELGDILKGMGMKLAFDPASADFTSMTESGNYFIDRSVHKTYIDVDEKGTEAAAVTAIMMTGTGLMPMPEPIEFKADKPFTFVIYDHTNKEVLFMGEYAYAE